MNTEITKRKGKIWRISSNGWSLQRPSDIKMYHHEEQKQWQKHDSHDKNYVTWYTLDLFYTFDMQIELPQERFDLSDCF